MPSATLRPISCTSRWPRRLSLNRVLDRVAVDVEQVRDAALGVEALLIGLTGRLAVPRIVLGVALDVGDGGRERRGVAWGDQPAVHPRGNELAECPVVRRDGRDSRGHGLHGDKAER